MTNEKTALIEGRIDKAVTDQMSVGSKGAIAFETAGQMMEAAKMMAVAGVGVPKHLRGVPGACLAVVMQATEWNMYPYAVANKSYSVNDRLAYEAQLIQAVINQRAPIKGRLNGEYIGDGIARQCKIWAIDKDSGERLEYLSPQIKDIKVQNSPLWKSDPDQQLWYYSARAFSRRHYPDVLLGVYEQEEMKYSGIGPDNARDVTPKGPTLEERMKAKAEGQPDPKEEIEDIEPDEGDAGEPAIGELITDDEQSFQFGAAAAKDPYSPFTRDNPPASMDPEKWAEGWDSEKGTEFDE